MSSAMAIATTSLWHEGQLRREHPMCAVETMDDLGRRTIGDDLTEQRESHEY